MTAAERLVALAGATGTAAALLLAVGSGATSGAALVEYSGLGSATAAVHLMTDHPVVEATPSGGGWVHTQKRRKTENDEALLLAVLL